MKFYNPFDDVKSFLTENHIFFSEYDIHNATILEIVS